MAKMLLRASCHAILLATTLLLNLVVGQVSNNRYDYVILGGGTAGMVIAGRLSENPNVTVAVVEAGDYERNNPNVTATYALGLAKNTRVDWQYPSLPQIYGGNQTLIWSAGKGLGGSSLINGMTYIRPASSQVDLWPSLGLDLGWAELFNSSKKGEHFQPPNATLNALGATFNAQAHGFSGPLSTCFSRHIAPDDLHTLFNNTFKKFGIEPRHEFDGGQLLGYGVQAVTQDGHADVREDAARAYYYPVMNRTNLVVMVNTTATRIIWASQNDPNGKPMASAAEVVSQAGQTSTIYADREVILSAGAIRSPAILENSGVGNPAILAKQSIDVKVSLSAVGENFQDQTTIAITAVTNATQNFTGIPAFVGHASLHDLLGNGTASFYNATVPKLAKYAATIASQNGNASNATVQEHLLRTQLDLLYKSNTPTSEIVPLGLQNLVGVIFWPLQPFSRGSVHINSTNMTAPPLIDGKFFQFDFDGALAVASARLSRKFVTTWPMSSIVNASTINPPFTLVPEDASDDVWLDWIKTKSAYAPNYHHLGTCAMLPRDMGGVVDNSFKVYGTSNVRVVDLSVIPLQVAGHSTALLYGVAEWAAVKIKAEQ
jgi:choline dehydrogenase-like flavoprotein